MAGNQYLFQLFAIFAAIVSSNVVKMKGDLSVHQILGILILIACLIIGILVTGSLQKLLQGVDVLSEKALQMRVEDQIKELNNFYEDFCKKDCDPYRASVLIAKVITYLWKDCYKNPACENNPAYVFPLSNYFSDHPITLTKKVNCDIYALAGWCTPTEIGTDKTDKVDEWTVTIWGLAANTGLCNEKLPGGGTWGNDDCKYEAPLKKCSQRCSGGNRISLFEEQITVDPTKTYNKISINYLKAGWTITGWKDERIEVTIRYP